MTRKGNVPSGSFFMLNAMSVDEVKQNFKVRVTRENVLFFITIIGVGVSCFNFLVLNQLAPIVARIQSVEARTQKLEDTSGTVASKADLENLSENLNTRFDDIKDNLSTISNRLDSFILK